MCDILALASVCGIGHMPVRRPNSPLMAHFADLSCTLTYSAASFSNDTVFSVIISSSSPLSLYVLHRALFLSLSLVPCFFGPFSDGSHCRLSPAAHRVRLLYHHRHRQAPLAVYLRSHHQHRARSPSFDGRHRMLAMCISNNTSKPNVCMRV